MSENEIRTLGYCAECGIDITDDVEEYYCDEDGHYFCYCECAMTYYGIHKLEI